MADDRVDPRYAAQFQRGYDPAVHPVAAASAPHPAGAREAPVRLPGGPPSTAVRIENLPPRSAPVAAPEVEPTQEEIVDEPALRSGLIEWALLIAAVGLLVAAVGLFWQASSDIIRYAGAPPAELAWSEIRNTLPGPLLAGAVLAGSMWLTLRALIGRER